MASKQGVVESFNPAGKKVGRNSTVYSFKLDDGEWYRTGFDKPDIGVGDEVKFDYSEGQYGKEVDIKSLKCRPNPNPPPQGKRGGGGGTTKDQYWENKEKRDIETSKRIGYAGCLNSALTLMANLGENFPVSASKLKSKDGLDAAMEVVVSMADEFYGLINSKPAELEAAKTEAEVPNGKDELEETEKAATPSESGGGDDDDGFGDDDGWG